MLFEVGGFDVFVFAIMVFAVTVLTALAFGDAKFFKDEAFGILVTARVFPFLGVSFAAFFALP